MKNKIIIIDYDAGNLKSVANMLSYLGVQCEITRDEKVIGTADKIIFPGQGHFAQAMENLNKYNLVNEIRQRIFNGVPFLGICLGLQILFEKSEEAPNVKGLSVFKGSVKKFKIGKTPQIGWNKVKITQNNSFLKDDYFYFVNSYYVIPEDKSIISATTDYHTEFCSAVEKDNICAVQFHPEKSCQAGCEFFEKWIKY